MEIRGHDCQKVSQLKYVLKCYSKSPNMQINT